MDSRFRGNDKSDTLFLETALGSSFRPDRKKLDKPRLFCYSYFTRAEFHNNQEWFDET
jgi:hypothetical protein